MNTWIIVLRIIHIVGGVFWVGGSLFLGLFIGPTVNATAEAGQKFMAHLMTKARLATRISAAAGLTVLAGAILYWIELAGTYVGLDSFRARTGIWSWRPVCPRGLRFRDHRGPEYVHARKAGGGNHGKADGGAARQNSGGARTAGICKSSQHGSFSCRAGLHGHRSLLAVLEPAAHNGCVWLGRLGAVGPVYSIQVVRSSKPGRSRLGGHTSG